MVSIYRCRVIDVERNYLCQYYLTTGCLLCVTDGVKYSLKTCETILYELSVTGCDIPGQGNEPPTKRQKADDDSSRLPEEELENLRQRIAARDELRENLIKKCRDGQKAAKQAIYALHREDFKRGKKLIDDCEKCILEQLIPIVKEEPQLRYGSFANVLEEYAEARLFYVWLVGEGEGLVDGNAAGRVLLPNDFVKVQLEPEEYCGGLYDVTGEIGRFAVKKGTLRDNGAVKLCLETDMSILYAFESLCKLPGGNSKKMEQLKRSVEKLEKMLYEMSLSQATGRKISAGVNEFETANNNE